MVFPIPAPLTPLRELDFFCHFDRSADGGGTKWRNLIVLSKNGILLYWQSSVPE